MAAAVIFSLATSLYPQLPIVGDPVAYNLSAQRLAAHGVYAFSFKPPDARVAPTASLTPGYVIFLAGVYKTFGFASQEPTASALSSEPAIVNAQFVLALFTVGLLAGCGLILGGKRLALVSGFMAALYLPFAWNTSVALGETLAATLATLQIMLALLMAGPRTSQRRGLVVALAFGVVSAAFAMVRPVMVLWIPVPWLYVAVRRMKSTKHLLALGGAVVVGVLLVMAPWWVRNELVVHRFVPLAENSGTVLLLSSGGTEVTAQEQTIWDAAAAQNKDPETTVAQYRLSRMFHQDPVGFIATKLGIAWTCVSMPWSGVADVFWALQYQPEIVQIRAGPLTGVSSQDLEVSHRAAGIYQLLLLVLAACALLLVRRSPRLLLVASIPIYVVAVYSTTLFISRYFFPAMPAVILLAATTLYWAAQRSLGLLRSHRQGVHH